MKGAHSIEKPTKRRGKVVAIVICVIIVLALVGAAIFLVTAGKVELPFTISQATNSASDSASSASQQDADQPEATSEPTDSASSSASAASEPQVYTNALFGYQVDIPEGFVLGSEVDNGSGIVLTNSSLRMTVNVTGYNNTDGLDADAILASLWNGSDDSIARAEGNRVIIYQYDGEYEYFYWVNIGPGSINQMEIRYPLQDDNRDELDAAQLLMQGFIPGDLNVAH